MLYTTASPEDRAGDVRLFLRHEDALMHQGPGMQIRSVAVHYDGLLHRLIPLLDSGRSSTIPARNLGDGSVVAQGPIPTALFLDAEVHAYRAG